MFQQDIRRFNDGVSRLRKRRYALLLRSRSSDCRRSDSTTSPKGWPSSQESPSTTEFTAAESERGSALEPSENRRCSLAPVTSFRLTHSASISTPRWARSSKKTPTSGPGRLQHLPQRPDEDHRIGHPKHERGGETRRFSSGHGRRSLRRLPVL